MQQPCVGWLCRHYVRVVSVPPTIQLVPSLIQVSVAVCFSRLYLLRIVDVIIAYRNSSLFLISYNMNFVCFYIMHAFRFDLVVTHIHIAHGGYHQVVALADHRTSSCVQQLFIVVDWDEFQIFLIISFGRSIRLF